MHHERWIWGVVVLMAVPLPCPAAAQEPVRRLTLEEAIEAFETHSPSLRIERAERRAARGEARQSRAYFNPEVSYTREDLDREDDAYRESILVIRQRIEWPGRTRARVSAAARRIESAESEFRADSLGLVFEVRRAYAKAWEAEAMEGALARATRAIRRVTTAAERRYEAGDISGFALQRLRVELASAEQTVAAGRLEAAEARRRLGALVLPEEDVGPVGPAAPLAGRPPLVAREAALAAAAARPDVRAAERGVLAAEAAASAAAQAWIPDPAITAGYKDQDDGFSGLVLGFEVPLPVLDRNGGAAAAAAARRDAAAARLALVRRDARNEALAALDRYSEWRDRLEELGENFPNRADDMLETARVAYEEDELGLVELLDAAEAYREAQLVAVELRTLTWIAYFDLLRAVGGDDAPVRSIDGEANRASGDTAGAGTGTEGGGP